jgi:hypothetical protein
MTALLEDNKPLGVIFNTNSRGRFDLLVYDDGLLAIRGTYVGVAMRGGGNVGIVGGIGAEGHVGPTDTVGVSVNVPSTLNEFYEFPANPIRE